MSISKEIELKKKLFELYSEENLLSFLNAKEKVKNLDFEIEDLFVPEIEENLNIINSFFNATLYDEIIDPIIDNDIDLIKENIFSLDNEVLRISKEINDSKELGYYFENGKISFEDPVFFKTIKFEIEEFNFLEPVIFELVIKLKNNQTKRIKVLPYNYEGSYKEKISLNKEKNLSIFNANQDKKPLFKTPTGKVINWTNGEEYIINEKIEINKIYTNYEEVIVEYDPTNFEYFLNEYVDEITLNIQGVNEYNIENFYQKLNFKVR